MKRTLIWIGYAIGGLVLTFVLGLGAYAIAVDSVSEPARPLRVEQRGADELAPTPARTSPKPSPVGSVDDKGGEDNSGSNSGSGSSNSGSGSSNSGSGSSGSGSDDDEPDDD